ncbi:g7434 [Coccomyxa elongata]
MNTDLRSYILSFRVAELQLCLQELGLSKKGLKADLQARLFAYFGAANRVAAGGVNPPREQHRLDSAARLITQIYHRMKGLPSPDAMPPAREDIPTAGYLQTLGDAPLVPPRPGLPNGASQSGARSNTQIRCICGINNDRGTMIQCEDEACGVWQHCDCMCVDLNAMPELYLCELCRLARADPFWRRVGAPVMCTVKLAPVQPPRSFDGSRQEEDVVQVADRHFTVGHAQLDPVRRQSKNFQLQVACIMLNDSVPMRIHWPRHADLRLNNMLYRPYARNSNTKLGANARDEPASIGVMCSQGRNRLWLSVMESRSFCVVVQLAQRRSMDEVRLLMAPPETVQAALQRVMRQTGGGKKEEGDESDDEVEIGRTVVSLRCPMSGGRMRTPARFASVGGLNAFDLDTFLDVVQRSRKWQCPHSMRNLPVQQLLVDAYLSHILARLKDMPHVTEVEVSPSGEWRVAGSEGRWHSILEDPAIPVEDIKVKEDPEGLKQEAGPLDSDSEEELSEGEELRRAAAAAKATLPPKPPPDVIVISDSDSDVEESYRAPPSAPSRPLVPIRPAAIQQTQQQPSSTAPRPATQSSGADRSQAGASTSERPRAPWAQDGSSQRPVSHAHRHQSGAARYGGPYPGSVPGTSGRASADAPAAGAIVRGRGITIRLPSGAAAPQPPPQRPGMPQLPAAQRPDNTLARGMPAGMLGHWPGFQQQPQSAAHQSRPPPPLPPPRPDDTNQMGADRYKQTAVTWMQNPGHSSSYGPSAPHTSIPAYNVAQPYGYRPPYQQPSTHYAYAGHQPRADVQMAQGSSAGTAAPNASWPSSSSAQYQQQGPSASAAQQPLPAGWNSGREVPSGQHGHGQPGDRTPDAFQEFLGELARGVGGGQSAPSQQGNGIGNHTGNFGEARRPRAEIVELDSD